MTGRSCWCLELFRKGQLTARNIDVVECSRLAPAVASREAASTGGLRCHASVPLYAGDRPLGVMNLAMRGWRRLTRAGARSADDDRRSGRRRDRAGAAGRAIDRARARRRALAHRPRRPRHARAGVHRRRPAHRSRPVAPRAAQSGAAGAAPGARRGAPGPRRGAAVDRAACGARRSRTARSPKALGGAVAPVHRRHRRARPRGHRRCRPAAGGHRIRAVPDRRRGADQRPQARAARARRRSGSPSVRRRLRLTVADAGARFQRAAARAPRVRPVGHRRSRARRRRPRRDPKRARTRHDDHGHRADDRQSS